MTKEIEKQISNDIIGLSNTRKIQKTYPWFDPLYHRCKRCGKQYSIVSKPNETYMIPNCNCIKPKIQIPSIKKNLFENYYVKVYCTCAVVTLTFILYYILCVSAFYDFKFTVHANNFGEGIPELILFFPAMLYSWYILFKNIRNE